MKGISTLLLVLGCLAIATQATYLRVIHAVPPGDMRMDVYYTAKDTGEKIRLFQDLNYTDIPPYFFVPVLQDQEQVTLSFLLKESSGNISETLFSQQELQGIPSHVVSLRQNFTYTLLVTGASQQPGFTEEQNVTENEDQSQGIQTQDMGLEYLLLNDFNEGDEAPEGMKFVRLINLAEDAMEISLIDAQGECGSTGGNQTEGNQTQGDSGEESQGSGASGSSSQPLADQLQYLEATDYLELPMTSEPLDLFVCHQGQKIPITPAPLYRADGSHFSILLFTGASSQEQQNEDLGSQSGDLGSESNDSSSQGGMGGDFVAYAVSDEPLTIPNVRIRIVHAESSLPAVNILVDGQQVFNQVAFGNVTEYTLVVRGIHNISLSPVSGESSEENQSQGNSSSLRIITFFAWTKSYTIAVVRTQSGQMGLEEQDQGQQGSEGQQQESGDMSIEMGQQEESGGEPTQTAGVTFPGFQGALHKIFLDDFSENATLGKNYAYVQFIHLASNVGAVNVNIGNQNISNIRFLQSSLYRSIQVTAQRSTSIQVLLASSNTPVFTLNTRLQPGTLYTLWALQDMNQAPRIFLTADRKVQIVCQVMDADMNSGEQSQGSDQ